MLIKVYSLNAVNDCIKNNIELNNWISIRDYGYSYLYKDIDKYCKNIFPVYFDDVTPYNVEHDMIHPYYKKVGKERDFIYFNKDIALNIKKFADDIYFKDKGTLHIHCFAGRSRSQGIAEILNVHYNLFLQHNITDYMDNLEFNNWKYNGNYEVEKIMKDVLYGL